MICLVLLSAPSMLKLEPDNFAAFIMELSICILTNIIPESFHKLYIYKNTLGIFASSFLRFLKDRNE